MRTLMLIAFLLMSFNVQADELSEAQTDLEIAKAEFIEVKASTCLSMLEIAIITQGIIADPDGLSITQIQAEVTKMDTTDEGRAAMQNAVLWGVYYVSNSRGLLVSRYTSACLAASQGVLNMSGPE